MSDVQPTHLDLCSGICGFALAARWAGFRTIGFSEIDPSANAVQSANFPGVHNFGDIGTVRGVSCDLVNAGIPCQPFSSASAGKCVGTGDDRFLWPEVHRILEESKPSWFLLENVALFEGVALEQVASDLESIAYEVWTLEIPACAVGCDHRRRRIWLLGYSDRNRQSRLSVNGEVAGLPGSGCEFKEQPASDGVPGELAESKRRELVGNAIVPQVAYEVLKAIRGML